MRRAKNEKHLDFIRSLPCIVCADNTATQACHIRYADERSGKRQTGMGEKPDDIWTVPMCQKHHNAQHKMNEREFWKQLGIDPILLALALSAVSGNHEAGEHIIRSWQGE